MEGPWRNGSDTSLVVTSSSLNLPVLRGGRIKVASGCSCGRELF